MAFKLKTAGFEKLFRTLDTVEKKNQNLRPAMKQAAVYMLRSIDQNFLSSGRPNKWKPLVASTLRQKRKLRRSPLPLQRTGRLRASITPETGMRFMQIGTVVSYARYHQTGTSRIPRRTFLLFQDKDLEVINKLVADYILSK